MQPEYYHKDQCVGKRRFAEKKTILTVINQFKERGRLFKCYWCELCNGWHLTTHDEHHEKIGKNKKPLWGTKKLRRLKGR